jgi:malonyl CoA-acyl carrier protein transacylase
MNFWGQGALVLVSVAIADFAWSRYNMRVADRKAHAAAGWSVGIVLLGAVSVVAYAHDWRMVAFAAVGAYLGTYVAVRYGH